MPIYASVKKPQEAETTFNMMRLLTTTIFFAFLIFNTQREEKVYFGRADNYSTVYSYSVTEFYVSSDSLLTIYNYRVPNKKEWRNYKKYGARKDAYIISKRGQYYYLVNPESGVENDSHCLKITEKKLTYYYRAEDGSLIKGFTFKRKN